MKAAGIDEARYTRTSIKAPAAADTILAALRAADAAGERVVIHCSGGSGRTSLGIGLWLADKYGLTPEQAAQEIAANAAAVQVVRNPDIAKLATLIERRTLAK
jgi:protein-tyrosine phosphatase